MVKGVESDLSESKARALTFTPMVFKRQHGSESLGGQAARFRKNKQTENQDAQFNLNLNVSMSQILQIFI